MGLKISICEFLKDLIGQEAQELKQMFNNAILDEVSQRFVLFFSDAEPEDFTEHRKLALFKNDSSSVPGLQGVSGFEMITVAPVAFAGEEHKALDEADVRVDKMLE